MKKTFYKLKHVWLLSLALVIPQLSMAATFRQTINQGIKDYLIPIFIVAILFGVMLGLARNWKDFNQEDTRKQALINIGWLMLIVLIIVGAVVGAASLLTTGLNNVQI